MKGLPTFHPIFYLIVATVLEVCGDATVRIALYNHAGLSGIRIALFFCGAMLLFGYGSFLNFAPLEFGQVVGLYIATLFVVWQIMNLLFFRTAPTLPIILGGALIIAGGTLITVWKE